MTQLNQKEFLKKADSWMKKQGFKNQEETLNVLLLKNLLEEERMYPDGLYENKDGDMFLVYFFDKSNYFPVKKHGQTVKWVTGFDSWKYVYLQIFETLLNIPSAIVFYNELENEFIFKTVLELGNPDAKWRQNKEYNQDILALNRKHFVFGSQEYRDGLRYIVRRLFRNTGKNKGMSVWDIEKFVEGQIKFNKRLL